MATLGIVRIWLTCRRCIANSFLAVCIVGILLVTCVTMTMLMPSNSLTGWISLTAVASKVWQSTHAFQGQPGYRIIILLSMINQTPILSMTLTLCALLTTLDHGCCWHCQCCSHGHVMITGTLEAHVTCSCSLQTSHCCWQSHGQCHRVNVADHDHIICSDLNPNDRQAQGV